MNRFLLLIFIISGLSCRAQSKVIAIYGDESAVGNNLYFKDADNDFNPYEGTWKQIGNDLTNITLAFKKVEKVHDVETPNFNQWNDHLIGEYSYRKNGVMIRNSLPVVYQGNPYKNNAIQGGNILRANRWNLPPCPTCSSEPRYIALSFDDPLYDNIVGKIVMYRYIEQGVEKLVA